MENWKISKKQKKILDDLLSGIPPGDITRVLDIGSGRTSIAYLTDKFKDLNVKGIVYPGDERKIKPIKECVKNTNYELLETDIINFDFSQEFDLAVAHLFLGEAEKFGENSFEEILNKLFEIKTKYLAIINLLRDSIDYGSLLKKIAAQGKIVNLAYEISEEGEECLGLLIQNI